MKYLLSLLFPTVQVAAIYYNEYPHRYDDGAGRIGNCAFGGQDGQAFTTVHLDPYDYGSTQTLTTIKPIELGHQCVTTEPHVCSGKDVLQKYNNGIPYFSQSETEPTWPSYYVSDVVGTCSSNLDFYAVSGCADWNEDGAQDKFLLLQEGDYFTKRNDDYENGGVEKFTATSLGNIFSVEWDPTLEVSVLKATIPPGGLTSSQRRELFKLDKAAIVVNMSCDVEPQPFTFAQEGIDDDTPWKKYPVTGTDLPGNWPGTVQVDHCMTFVLHLPGSTYPCHTYEDPISPERLYFTFPSDDKKLLDLRPDDVSSSLIDVAGFNPPAGLNIFDDIRDIYGTSLSGVPPDYHSETSQKCSPPSNDTWPGTGCICFEPNDLQGTYQHVSYYDMVDAEGPGTSLTRFRTAFNTSVTGGLTVSGWFKAGDTSNEPHNANPGYPGQQTSMIFVRGEKASWKAGYNFGLGNWHGWTFQVILNGGAVRVQSSTVNSPGIDEWHYVIGTYDAEAGKLSLYVDNNLVAHTNIDSSWTREMKDVLWISDSETALSRIANGYDANDKQFVGCIGGLTVHGGVTTASIIPPDDDDEDEDSTQPDACERRRRMSQSMEEKWGIGDPSFDYEDNTFELDFEISDLISSVDQIKPEWFYDDCTTPYAGVALTPSKAANFTTTGASGPDKQIIGVYMEVDPETIESETDVFTVQQQVSGQRMATIALCMKFVLNTPPLTANPNDYMEVNFLEVTTTLNVDLTDGFEIDEISVARKSECEEAADAGFQVEGYFCEPGYEDIPISSSVPLVQGSAVTICVRPQQEGLDNFIRMRRLRNFTFYNEDTQQVAVANYEEARNGLTNLHCVPGYAICHFDTILQARFFSVQGFVNGTGFADLQFGGEPSTTSISPRTRRRELVHQSRLRSENSREEEEDLSRRLQQEENPFGDAGSATASFDMTFGVIPFQYATSSSSSLLSSFRVVSKVLVAITAITWMVPIL